MKMMCQFPKWILSTDNKDRLITASEINVKHLNFSMRPRYVVKSNDLLKKKFRFFTFTVTKKLRKLGKAWHGSQGRQVHLGVRLAVVTLSLILFLVPGTWGVWCGWAGGTCHMGLCRKHQVICSVMELMCVREVAVW